MRNSGIVLLGPWGVEYGSLWNYTPKGVISRISVMSDDHVIYSISFTSQDEHGNSDTSDSFGSPGFGSLNEIDIIPGVDKLILMEGIVSDHDLMRIRLTQLSFTTSKNGVITKHGPYGSERKGTEFSCLLSKDQFAGFHGHSSRLLCSIGVSVVVPKTSGELVPSCGGDRGDPWSYTTLGTISRIFVSYSDDFIRGIRFTSVDANGGLDHSNTFGDSDPEHEYHEIKIDTTVEKLNGIRGTFGSTKVYEKMITSLAFTTNNLRTFGTFGNGLRNPFEFFEYKVSDDQVISGFHGRAGSSGIDDIGIYKRPSKVSTNGVVVGPFGGEGGNKWSYEPKGLISRISIGYYSDWILSICFESVDEHGITFFSPIYGEEGNNMRKYVINIEGKLNCMGGTIAPYPEGTYLTSLYFKTDQKITHGPFGNPSIGTHFSIPVKDGFISGFHGSNPVNRARKYYHVETIGVYVNSTHNQ